MSVANSQYKINFEEQANLRLLQPEDGKGTEYPKQKYRNQVFIELYFEDRIPHSTLANRIDVSASGLNAIIKKLNDTDEKPIYEVKVGKYKFYQLSESGKLYVRSKILPSVTTTERDIEQLYNIFSLFNIFKDGNRDTWCQKLKDILEYDNKKRNNTDEDEDIIYECIKELIKIYSKDKECTSKLISLVVADHELCEILCTYLEKKSHGLKAESDILNMWLQQDFSSTYQLVDYIEQLLLYDKRSLNECQFNLAEAEQYLHIVLNKLLADMFQALYKDWDKQLLFKHWTDSGIDKHLSMYLAEKYYNIKRNLLFRIINPKESTSMNNQVEED